MYDEYLETGTSAKDLSINKGLVLDSLKTACLIGSWARWVKSAPAGNGGGFTDNELEEDLESWTLVVELSNPGVATYDQVLEPQALGAIMTGLSVALLLSSDKNEYFEIRREWYKIGRWLKEEHGIEPGEHVCALLDDSAASILSVEKNLDVIAKYLPELKQGWSDGRADGVQDYLTVMRLRLVAGNAATD